MTTVLHSIEFFKQFVTKPASIGAVAPSSRFLAQKMLESVDIENAKVVVECGPGTGIFTKYILPRISPGASFHAIEINPHLARILRERYPGIILHEDTVANVAGLLAAHGDHEADVIVCGLPWASFKESLQNELLDALLSVLKPGGQFVSYGYMQGLLMPAGMRFRRKIQDRFEKVRLRGPVWLNLPPAIFYDCQTGVNGTNGHA